MVARSCPQTYYSKIKIPKFIIAHFDYQKSIWSHYSHTFIHFSSLSWIQQKSLHQWNLNNLRICFLFPLVAFLFLFFWYFRSLLQGFTRVHEKKTCKCPENCNGQPRFTCNGRLQVNLSRPLYSSGHFQHFPLYSSGHFPLYSSVHYTLPL